jgi:Methyltransferase FkbM domain
MFMVESYSQFGQDLFVAESVFGGRRGGFFVEAGAGDGLWISNTLLLERKYGWTGILIEPTSAYAALKHNRSACICDDSCLASEAKQVTVVEIFDRGQAQMWPQAQGNLLLSRTTGNIAPFDVSSMNSHWGIAQTGYVKGAVSLAAVLRKHRSPQHIDYLSLDVEGFEYEILRTFPFDEFQFGCLGIECPPSELHELLLGRGYAFVAKLGEDWFYRPAPAVSRPVTSFTYRHG